MNVFIIVRMYDIPTYLIGHAFVHDGKVSHHHVISTYFSRRSDIFKFKFLLHFTKYYLIY